MNDENVKRWIEVDELFPYYTLSENTYYNSKSPQKFSPEFIDKYKRVMTEFIELQEELEKIHDGQ